MSGDYDELQGKANVVRNFVVQIMNQDKYEISSHLEEQQGFTFLLCKKKKDEDSINADVVDEVPRVMKFHIKYNGYVIFGIDLQKKRQKFIDEVLFLENGSDMQLTWIPFYIMQYFESKN